MKAQKLQVVFYRTDAGNEPVRVFLKEQSAIDKHVIGTDIKTVQFGWPLGMPLVRKLHDNLWEVRCSVSHGIVRVLFTVMGNNLVLLHAFTKKTQKIPSNELQVAMGRLKQVRED